MRHLATIAGVGILTLVLAGCAGGGSTSPGAPGSGLRTVPNTPVTTAPVTPGTQVPPGGTEVPANQVKMTTYPATFPRTVWTDNGGTELGFYGEQGGCFTSTATVAQQSDTQVVVRLAQQEPGTGSHMCPMYVRYKPMTVALAAPLGSRTVVLQMSIVRG